MASIFCSFPDPIDFDSEDNLFHFDLHRAIGKGAFGKVRSLSSTISVSPLINQPILHISIRFVFISFSGSK